MLRKAKYPRSRRIPIAPSAPGDITQNAAITQNCREYAEMQEVCRNVGANVEERRLSAA